MISPFGVDHGDFSKGVHVFTPIAPNKKSDLIGIKNMGTKASTAAKDKKLVGLNANLKMARHLP